MCFYCACFVRCKGYSFELCRIPHDKWVSVGTHSANADTLFSAIHTTDSAHLAAVIVSWDIALPKWHSCLQIWNCFGCLGCWTTLFHVNKVWNELWKWAGDTGRETAGVSVDKHWRGRAGCGGCASSKPPSRKIILCLSFFFLFQKFSQRNAHRLKYTCNSPTGTRSSLCVVSLMAAVWLIHPPMWLTVWKLRVSCEVLNASYRTLFRPGRILFMLIYFLCSFSHCILLFHHHPSCLSVLPSPPLLSLLLLQKIRPSSVQFSLARIQRGPGSPPLKP